MKSTIINRIALVMAAIAVMLGATNAFAQSTASASADASAKIVSGISLEKSRDLNFGSIVRSSAGGEVTVNPNSGAISFKGVTQGQTRNHQAATFNTTGETDYLYTISLPKSATLTNAKDSKATMTVKDFTYSDGAGKLDKDGKESFNVGGTLEVGPNQATGSYSGSFEVAVQYQ